MEKEKRVCLYCGENISHTRYDVRYCSKLCKSRAAFHRFYPSVERKTLCFECGKEIVNFTYKRVKKYCSSKCRTISWYRKQVREDNNGEFRIHINRIAKESAARGRIVLSDGYINRVISEEIGSGSIITPELRIARRELILLKKSINYERSK